MSAWEDLQHYVEAPLFAALCNHASATSVLLKTLARDDEFVVLVRRLDTRADVEAIADRVVELSGVPAEDAFEHRHDAEVTAYLLALNLVEAPSYVRARRAALKMANGWWTPSAISLIDQGRGPTLFAPVVVTSGATQVVLNASGVASWGRATIVTNTTLETTLPSTEFLSLTTPWPWRGDISTISATLDVGLISYDFFVSEAARVPRIELKSPETQTQELPVAFAA